jgi:photosynthetic reaction center H subunit
MRGAITEYIDVAQIVLYAFWAFFIGLIIYLRREDKREGYPLESDRTDRAPGVPVQGFPAMPEPKTFKLPHGGGEVSVPNKKRDQREIKLTPAEGFAGSAFNPTGNPMLDGVGPASWVERSTHPEVTDEGHPRMIPMRLAKGYSYFGNDPDPRGFQVIAADGLVGGIVQESWVDIAEPQIRFLEIQVTKNGGPRTVLLPITYVKWDIERRAVRVRSITSAQFADVPGLANPDQISLREEDQITAYYAGGTLYATPDRFGPLI